MQLAGDDAIRKLVRAGWVGDVLWRPYSTEGPITDNIGIRPVTMFELGGLVRLAGRPDRHVYLVVGPCPQCSNLKTEALRPILTRPGLRICNHLVIDTDTAYSLLRPRQD
jgi:DNA-binding transcriptional regulator LsrR (DeoR family)